MKTETKFKKTEIGMIPEDWDPKKLSDIALYVSDKSNITNFDRNSFISTENLLPNKGGVSELTSFPTKGNFTVFKEEDVLFSNIRTYFKKLWLANFEGGCSNDVLVIRPRDKSLDNTFLFYYLSQDSFFDYTVVTAKGTKMPRGDKVAIMNFNINLPKLPEQKAITKILSDLDSKIEVLQRQNESLEGMGQLLFRRWFVDFEFPDEDSVGYGSGGGEMTESELGEIPVGWRVGKLGDYAESISGCSYTSKGLNPSNNALVTLKSIGVNGFRQEGFKEYTGDYKDKHIVKDGDIVVAHTDLTQNRIVLGKPVIIRDLGKYKIMFASMDLSIVKPTKLLNKPYLFYLLSTRKFHGHAQGYANGTTVIHLGRKAIPEFTFVVPAENILKEFKKFSDNIFGKKRVNDVRIQSLTKLRDTLLPKLMSGKIRIK